MKIKNTCPILYLFTVILLTGCFGTGSAGEPSGTSGSERTSQTMTAPTRTDDPSHKADSSVQESPKPGNQNRNYINGLVAENEDWVWFSDLGDSYRLCRMRPDGRDLIKMETTFVKGKNVMDGDLYYVKSQGNDSAGLIYRRDEGGNVSQISSVHTGTEEAFLTLGEEIFFSNGDDGGRLYRMKPDGSKLTRMSEQPVMRINAEGSWIIYLTDDNVLRRIRPDGSQDTEFLKLESIGTEEEERPAVFIADQGWVYFQDRAGLLHRIQCESPEKKTVVSEPVHDHTGFSLEAGRLYFIDGATRRLTSCRLDGSDRREMTEKTADLFQVAGDWIYFGEGTGQRWFRIRPDGSDEGKAYTLPMAKADPAGLHGENGLGILNTNLGGSDSRFSGDDRGLYYAGCAGIFRMEPDGSHQQRIFSHVARRMNLVGDWIYFIDRDAYGSIARVRTNGNDYSVVYDGFINAMIVQDGWIYFAEGKTSQICKVRTDGTEFTILDEGLANRLNLDGEWLYWFGYVDSPMISRGIHRVKTDGTDSMMVYDGYVGSPIVTDDSIYFNQANSGNETAGTLMRIGKDGSRPETLLTLVSSDGGGLKGVYKDWIYYLDTDKKGYALFRIRLDGTEKDRLTESGERIFLYFLGDQIIFYPSGKGIVRIMPLDGSELKTIDKLPDERYTLTA